MIDTIFLVSFILLFTFLVSFIFKKINLNYIVVFLCSCTIIFFVLFPKLCMESTLAGAKLFFTSVFPSLFPFLIICNLLIEYNGVNIYAKYLGRLLCKPLHLPTSSSIVVIISMLCGYPLGAKYSCDLYEKGTIDKETCQRMLNIASNASPIFIIGTLGNSMFKNSTIGFIILCSNYLSCILMSFFISPPVSFTYIPAHSEKNINTPNIGSAIKKSIENAIRSSISIGGYIIFFAVLIDIINYNFFLDFFIMKFSFNSHVYIVLKSLILGSIEFTKGCKMISLINMAIEYKCVLASFLMCFSGLSVISQVYSFMYVFPELSISKYIKRKFIQGLFASLCSAVLLIINSYVHICI
ncbi:sporulation integral membrane protein YlbJ [Clostridium oryzae]|uniref:Sporulation integral membrane protein YlbJ n=1 Tax=Clostridium oryzae TaxID=1450648 RepID=A0A1V4IPM7_9CLOT|nr:sporulation integral membrane protein YlbJ [Clostridium oryzae]OPJ61770.1 sporulation integral membrane protein YlbJ [Clostridium oryzae]